MTWQLNGYRTRQLYTKVLNRIRRSFKPGDRLGTQVELARHYGVSVQTMQRVLGTLAQQGWITRSRRSGTFVSPRPAQVGRRVLWLSAVPRDVILGSRFYRDVLACVAYGVTSMGASLSLASSPGETAEAWSATLDELDLSQVDALLAVEPPDGTVLAQLTEQLPVIVLEAGEPCPRCSMVGLDHREAVATAMDRLKDLGHERVGFWGQNWGGQGQRTRACYQAFLEWTARARRVPPRQWLSIVEGPEQYVNSAEQFVSAPAADRPTALLICGNAHDAVGCLGRGGIRAGADISIIAVGDASEPADGHLADLRHGQSVTLAGFRPDLATLGRLVGQEVQRRLTDATARPQTLLAPVVFCDGQSCRRA